MGYHSRHNVHLRMGQAGFTLASNPPTAQLAFSPACCAPRFPHGKYVLTRVMASIARCTMHYVVLSCQASLHVAYGYKSVISQVPAPDNTGLFLAQLDVGGMRHRVMVAMQVTATGQRSRGAAL